MRDSIWNYDPETGIHRGYDVTAASRRAEPRREPPARPWDKLTQIERDRGYDIYGRRVSGPSETSAEAAGKDGARASGWA